MKSLTLVGILVLVVFVAYARADCEEESSMSAEDGDVKHFFKTLSCKIQKGTEKLQENTKPWTDKISATAKEFGGAVVQNYDKFKHKLAGDEHEVASSTPLPIANAPTEKVPLAPLDGEANGKAA